MKKFNFAFCSKKFEANWNQIRKSVYIISLSDYGQPPVFEITETEVKPLFEYNETTNEKIELFNFLKTTNLFEFLKP